MPYAIVFRDKWNRPRRRGENVRRFRALAKSAVEIFALAIITYGLWSPKSALPTDRLQLTIFWVAVAMAVVLIANAIFEQCSWETAYVKRFRLPQPWGWTEWPIAQRLCGFLRLDDASRRGRADDRIARYLASMLRGTSRATILTRDMSWSTGKAKTELDRLAKNGALTLLAHHGSNGAASDIKLFEDAGAVVYWYLTDLPVRFTVVQNGSWEAIAFARVDKKHHEIHYVESRSDPSFELAKALVTSIKENV